LSSNATHEYEDSLFIHTGKIATMQIHLPTI
jgi:hypothetical protein